MNSLIQEIIAFLIDNEQYGDNWTEHINLLNKLKQKQAIIDIMKADEKDELYSEKEE